MDRATLYCVTEIKTHVFRSTVEYKRFGDTNQKRHFSVVTEKKDSTHFLRDAPFLQSVYSKCAPFLLCQQHALKRTQRRQD